MTTPWFRIEGRVRSAAMTGGVEARIADPLWMLARQWQVGEFIGDDAGSPLAATTRFETTSVDATHLSGGGGESVAYDPATPLERTVEAAAAPRHGGARLARSARAAQTLTRLLRQSGAESVVSDLAKRFPLPESGEVTLGARGDAVAAMLRRRSFDGLKVAALPEAELRKFGNNIGDPALSDKISAWRRSTRARFSTNDGAWRSDRMEHDFSVTAPTVDGEKISLRADGYTGGRLDWYSFDVQGESHRPLAEQVQSFTTIPTQVRYDGMPASRWWEFEDAGVQFGDLDAGPTDLSRMIVADFATVYGDDWFVVPLELENGTICRVQEVEIIDNFGETTTSKSIVAPDARAKLGRSWSMFEMHGDTSIEHDVAPLLFLPPVLSTSLHGPTSERVEFARDEGANLGWAIERSVEGPLGRAVDRREAWLASMPPEPPPTAANDDATRYEDEVWRYRLESPAPPFWVPLLPQRITEDRSDIHFRRGRLQSWDHLTDIAVGAHGETLEPHRSLIIREEEIPRGGITVERRWQYSRWIDGSVHVWIQRRRRQGRGERSSGLGWDILEN